MSLNGPAEIVQDAYSRSLAYAGQMKSELSSFLGDLSASVYTAPSISTTWSTVGAPGITPVPNAPGVTVKSFTLPGGQPATSIGALPAVVVDEFTALPPTLSNPVAPTVNFGTVPTLPTLRDVTVPEAPVVTLPSVPTMLALNTHTFGGIDLHEDWLDKLDTIPELSVLQPEKLQYVRGPQYASQLLDNLKATINARLMGGSGLLPAVEQALWDRARDRETQIALMKEQEVMRGAESLGFPMPAGAAFGALADARREYHDKLSGLSRDIAIKQAEMEQDNLKNAIASATQLESQLIDYSYKIERLVFEAAQAAATNEVQVFNANVEHFKALLAGYQAYAAAYDTLIKAELTKIEVYKALLSAEQTKAQINLALVQQYKAQIDGAMAGVEIFRAQVSAAQTLVSLEQTRMQAGAEQIKAFVATNNAEMSKVELFKAQIGADGLKLEGYKTQAQVYATKAGVQTEKARVAVAQYQAQTSAISLAWDGWKAQVNAQATEIDASAKVAGMQLDAYKTAVTASGAHAELNARVWESSMKQYEAGQNLALQAAKINNDALIHTNDARMEAAKVGAQVVAQQVASALNIVNTSASISGSVSQSI